MLIYPLAPNITLDSSPSYNDYLRTPPPPGVRSNTGGDAATLLPTTPEMSPISSPVPPAERDVPMSTTASTAAAGINGPSSSAPLPAGLSSQSTVPSRLPPLPKPRPKPRQHSPDLGAARRGLIAAADVSRSNRGDGEVEGVGGGAISNGLEAHLSHANVENSLPEEALLEVKSPPPPPVPAKKTAGGRRIIIPDEDVVFELEDVPMPETPQVTSLPVDIGREGFESAPLLHESREPPLSLQTEISPLPPSVSPVPALPPKEDTARCTSASPIPTLPPKDVGALSESSQIPILPPRETDVSPAYPSIPTLPLKDKEEPPQSSSMPALPPKEIDSHSVEVSELTVAAVSPKQPSVVPTESLDLQPELSTPPLPARRHFVAEVESADLQVVSTKTPPLPRRDTGPPSFSPPPPPVDLEDKGEAQVPPLPPPRTSTLSPSAQKNGSERESEGGRLSPPTTLASMPELTGLDLPQDAPAHREPASDNFVPSHQIQSVWNDDDNDIIPVVGLESLAPPTTNNDELSGGETSPEHNFSASQGEAELNLIGNDPLPPTLPPKEHQQQPPPPPPITPDDFPEDYSTSDMSDSDEDSRPLMSIQSTRNQQDDDRMMLAQAPSSNGGTFYSHNDDDDSYNTTPSSSAESTPKKKTLIRQSGSSLQRGFTDDDIMVVSPKPPLEPDDYMNQEVIDKVTQDADDDIIMVTPKPREESEDYMNQEAIDKANQDMDYMNQDAIDQSLADEDDVNATNIEREHFVIRGSSPIKSRTLELKRAADKDRDYENQDMVDEVLEGDIIPVGTISSPEGDIIPVGPIPSLEGDIIPVGPIPSPEAPTSKMPQPVARRDYAYSVSVAAPMAKQKVKRHKYEEMEPISPTRSNTVCFDGKQLIFRSEREDSGPTSLPIIDNSSTSSTQRDRLASPEDDLEMTLPLESSGGSINQTFPRTASTVSSQYKPSLPKQRQEPSSSSGKVIKRRSSSLEDTMDVDGGVSASAPNRPQGGYNEVSTCSWEQDMTTPYLLAWALNLVCGCE